jgi:hypothetical protein
MLSIHQFRRLSLNQKLITLDRKAIDLSVALVTGTESRMLFSLYGFYVEVIFIKASPQIKMVRSFSSTKYLNPYLEQINIDDLTILLSFQ